MTDVTELRRARFERETISCPVCGSQESEFELEKNGYTLVRCTPCSLVYVNPMPLQAEIEEFYRREYYDQQAFKEVMGFPHHYLNDRDPVEVASIVPVLKLLERFSVPGRLLDIGCGDGMFLRIAREWGWDPCGVEPSSKAASEAQSAGIPVVNSPVTEAELEPHSFDAIVCLQVIEHVPDPISLLSCAHRWLKAGGVLLVSTPNVLSLERRQHGVGWVSFTPPGHLVYFSIPSMRLALSKTGFARPHFFTNSVVIHPPSLSGAFKQFRSASAAQRPSSATGPIAVPTRPAPLDPARAIYDRLLLTLNEWLGRVLNRQGRDLVVVARAAQTP